jgi:hypothetical protein
MGRRDSQMQEELERCLQDFIERLRELPLRSTHTNLFDIAGRGYYENPTTDLLAFFVDQNNDHGLGSLVLESLCESILDSEIRISELQEEPEREYVTLGGNFVDLVINADEWVLVIENKIRHIPNNPFEEYRNSIELDKRFSNKRKVFAILSPYDPRVDGWLWIPYESFVSNLKRHLGCKMISEDISKWMIFLREFILNLEAQLMSTMDNSQFDFVRSNYADFVKANALHDLYIKEVSRRIYEMVANVFGGEAATVKRHSWEEELGIALRAYPVRNAQRNVTLLLMPDGGFRVQFYVESKSILSNVTRDDFMLEGLFESYEDEDEIWVFARDETDFNLALESFKQALTLLRSYLKLGDLEQ